MTDRWTSMISQQDEQATIVLAAEIFFGEDLQ
jgi:hypothetical protein